MATRTLKSTAKPANKWDRSTSYRKDFFATNKGLLGGWLYFCAYCGKPLTRKKVQVDHHIAINYVKHNPLQKLYFGIGNVFSNIGGSLLHGKNWKKNEGVNVSYNLLPACARCNQKKSDKGGIWIVRGMIGGGIWKILNTINNLFIALFTKPLGLLTLASALAAFLFLTPQGSAILAVLQ